MMEDIGQNISHLSSHLISTLSKTSTSSQSLKPSKRPDDANWEPFDGAFGFLNHNLFLRNLRRGPQNEKSGEQVSPLRIFARFWPSFGDKREGMSVASSRVHVVDEGKVEETWKGEGKEDIRQLEGRQAVVGYPLVDDYEYGKLNGIIESLDTVEGGSGSAVSKEELGRSTWTFLHTLAAQFPDHPTKQQQRDAKDLMQILSRIYPCKECADHFKEVLRAHPVEAGSAEQLAQWMCRVHNVVNRSLGKDQFPCHRVDLRWGALDCNEGVCDLHGRLYRAVIANRKTGCLGFSPRFGAFCLEAY